MAKEPGTAGTGPAATCHESFAGKPRSVRSTPDGPAPQPSKGPVTPSTDADKCTQHTRLAYWSYGDLPRTGDRHWDRTSGDRPLLGVRCQRVLERASPGSFDGLNQPNQALSIGANHASFVQPYRLFHDVSCFLCDPTDINLAASERVADRDLREVDGNEAIHR